ncbi:cation:proton antiporter, partial [Staphylococcus pseudintermedius]
FIVPQWIVTHVITPAFRGFVHTEALFLTAPHLAQWHGYNSPLLMSVTVIVLGIVGVFSFSRIRMRFLSALELALSVVTIFYTSYESLVRVSVYGFRRSL